MYANFHYCTDCASLEKYTETFKGNTAKTEFIVSSSATILIIINLSLLFLFMARQPYLA